MVPFRSGETLVDACQLCSDELTPSQKSFHRVIILLPVATNQLKAQDIESAARRTTVFGSDHYDQTHAPWNCADLARHDSYSCAEETLKLRRLNTPNPSQKCSRRFARNTIFPRWPPPWSSMG